MSHPDAVWLRRYLEPISNGTFVIVGVDVHEDEDGAWPVLKLRGSDENGAVTDLIELEISRDEEGNGPGFIFGLPVPEPISDS